MLNKKRTNLKGFKKTLAAALAFVLFMTPVPASLAAETNSATNITTGSAIETESTKDTKKLTGYEAVKAIADEKLAYLTTNFGVTSAQYALIDNGEIKISGQSGVYSKTSNIKLSDNTMYGIGSISKVYTTVAVMQLVDAGKINLDEPVVTYIPEFKMADERYKDITVRMLLNHSSGILGSIFKNSLLYGEGNSVGHDNFLKELSKQRLKADPGAFSVYCNDGFTLAEIVVERVSNMSFTSYIEKKITTPAKANYTKTPLSNFNTDRLAKTYNGDSKKALPSEGFNVIGAGGIYSTAADLCLFAQTFMKDSNGLLSAESIKAMESKEYLNGIWKTAEDNIINYGLGWDSVNTFPFNQYGIKALVKGGDTISYHGSLIVLPEYNMAIAILSSGGTSTYGQLLGQEILLSALKETGRINEIKPYKTIKSPEKQDMPADMTGYNGLYGATSGITKIKISEDGILRASNLLVPSNGEEEYVYVGNGKFSSSDGATIVDFKREKNGITYIGLTQYYAFPGLGETATSFYNGQKLDSVEVSQKAIEAWGKRNYKSYFIVDEQYNSILYTSPIIGLATFEELPGYMFNSIIVDENHAIMDLQIPGLASRDLMDFEIFTKGNVEYLNAKNNTYISADGLKALSSKSKFTVSIGSEGYSKWYYIGSTSANKTVKIKTPKNSGYIIYDKNFAMVENSSIEKKSKVKLPKDGFIVFVGNAGTKLNVNYTK